MADVETRTLTIKVPVRVGRVIGRRNETHVAGVGRFATEAGPLSTRLGELGIAIAQAIEKPDLGEIIAWRVAGERLVLLHSRHDGRYQVVSGLLEVGKPDHCHGDSDTPESGRTRLEAALSPAPSRRGDREAHVEAFRQLALSIGVDPRGEWPSVAQRIGMQIADWRSRIEESGLACLADLLSQAAEQRELSPEGAALARLLGVRRDPVVVRREALAVMTSTMTSRWSATLADLRRRGEDAAATVDRIAAELGNAATLQARLDDMIASDDVEATIVESDWTLNGPLDELIARRIAGLQADAAETDAFAENSLAEKALAERIKREIAAAADGCLPADAHQALRDDLAAALNDAEAAESDRGTSDLAGEVITALGEARVQLAEVRAVVSGDAWVKTTGELAATRDLCAAFDGELGVVQDALAELLDELEHRGVDLPPAVLAKARAALDRQPVREVACSSM